MNAVSEALKHAEPDTSIKIDGKRLWDSLMTVAKIGATPKGGVCRLALTDLDKWHAYETDNPQTFRRMYVFMVRKN